MKAPVQSKACKRADSGHGWMKGIANDPTRCMTGGRALAEMLKLHRCGPVFGMGGFQLLPFYDAVRELGIGHTLINDERCGAFAADAFARITGRPGVCDATLGPGATNLATGLVESLNAGVPLIAIVGNTNRAHSWKNMTQESRQDEILAPAAKALIRIEDGRRMPELVRRAYTVATSGRPGPVVLDVPEDVAHGEFDYPRDEFRAGADRIPARRIRPGRGETEAAAELLRNARRPLVLAGGGVHLSGAWAALRAFVEAESIPVAHTLSGKGALPCGHPLSVGLFGRWSRIANDLMERSDCLLAVGCKMGEIATRRYLLPPASVPFIQLDIVAEEIGRSNRVDVGLWGDAAEGLGVLSAALGGGPGFDSGPDSGSGPGSGSHPGIGLAPGSDPDSAAERRVAREPWLAEAAARMVKWREEAEPRYTSDERPIHMARLIRELQRVMPEEGVLVVDGGFAAHWTGLLYDSPRAGRCYVANRGFASIGYGLPGAMGAQLATRAEQGDAPVVGITGDGGFNMVLGELETARRLELGITLAIVNNAASGYVKALQHSLYGGNYQSSDLSETDYAGVARALGCEGIRVEDPARLGAAFRAGMASRETPTVIDVVVTRDPARMLPGVDSRAAPIRAGDRPA